MRSRQRQCGLVVMCLLVCGCGVTQNPTAFPSILPTGDIRRTHAKPPLFGYFRDYDPHACRLEVRPLQSTNPVQTQQLLIATVYDEHDQPRRRRRIEWIVEGAGNIVEVDESGLFGGRGYKVDNKYAVSYTDHCEHTFTRGNLDPNDDFTIRPGQSWCVISSAVEGDTQVTVYAPEIFNWDKHKVTVSSHWIDAEPRFPPPVVCRAGTQAVLTTQVVRHTDRAPLNGYRVRYRLLDGPSALLLPTRGGEETVATDLNGNASVGIAQLAPVAGANRVGIEVIRPPDPTRPSGPGIVVAQGETRVDWQGPQLSLAPVVPPTSTLGQDVQFTLNVSNTGQVPTQEITLRESIPEGMQFVRSEPPATVDGNQLVWTLTALPGGKGHSVHAVFRSTRAGPVKTTAVVTTRDGLRDEKVVGSDVTVPQIAVKIAGPPTAVVNGIVGYDITVSNPGTGVAENVLLLDEFDAAFEHETRANPIKMALGNLAPGESKVVQLKLTARQAGQLQNRVTATAAGNLKAKAEQPVAVQRASLRIDTTGPTRGYQGRQADWKIVVSNVGDAALGNVVVKDLLPAELAYVSAVPPGTPVGNEVNWALGTLHAGEKREIAVTTNCVRMTPRALNVGVAMADPGLKVQSEAGIEILGLPAFRLKVQDTLDPVEVGGRTTYRIEVMNQGTLAGDQVQVTAVVPPQMAILGGQGPGQPRVEKNRLVFPPVASLAAGQTVNYTVDVQAIQPGDARFQVELRAAALREPVIGEESTTVMGNAPPPAAPPPAGRLAPVPAPSAVPIGVTGIPQ